MLRIHLIRVRWSIRYESLTLRSVCMVLGRYQPRASLVLRPSVLRPSVLRPSLRCSASNRSSSFHSYLLISSASHICYSPLRFRITNTMYSSFFISTLRAYSVGLILRSLFIRFAHPQPPPGPPSANVSSSRSFPVALQSLGFVLATLILHPQSLQAP